MFFGSVKIVSQLDSQSKFQVFTLFSGRHIAGFQCHAIKNKNQNHSIDKVQILRKERR